jgi:ERCC4-type nuclease
VGSVELVPELHKQGIDARPATLDSADFAFAGNGPDGDAEFGIERKTLPDFIDSARSGRLYGISVEQRESQLDRMLGTYDFAWLLVEGDYSTDGRGRFVQARGRRGNVPVAGGWTEDMLNKTLLSLDLRGGIRVKETRSTKQTVRWLASLFRSHTDKAWSEHTTLRTLQRRESIVPVSSFRDMVMRMDDVAVGFAVSKAVEEHVRSKFKSIQEPRDITLQTMLQVLLEMSLHDWENLEVPERGGTTRKFGTSRALRVMEAFRRSR